MNQNPLVKLHEIGQSIWLDYIDRDILENGMLQSLINDDALAGLTSNPAIFEKAIAGGGRYQREIESLTGLRADAETIYHNLVLGDIGRAADLFRPVYDASGGRDGYVSIEVSPLLARDTVATVAEARSLWRQLDRPNIMIKVPGTREGLPAIRQLIADGINVNVTLLFSVARYVEVMDAWMSGLEERAAHGLPLHNVASVASFFLSRIDVAIDGFLDNLARRKDPALAGSAADLRGQAAIASAARAYLRFCECVAAVRWCALADKGARTQRLLWASTGTKDPAYSDVKYVEALIAPDTVNTLPMETLTAYRDHGQPHARIEETIANTREVRGRLADIGVDLDAVEAELEEEGIRKFIEPFQSLLTSLQCLRQAG